MSVAAAPPLREIRGPSAYEGGWRRFLHLTWTISLIEFRLNYFGSVLGPIWAVMRPLMLFGVLYLVFTQVVRFGSTIEDYPAVLLLNIVLFTFFQDATRTAVDCVVRRESIVRKMHFPRMVIPLSTVATAGLYLVQNLAAVIVFLLIAGIEPRWTWLLLPIVVAAMVVLSTGVAMILASLYPRYRDVSQIWMVLSTLLFYASPVLFVVDIVPPSWTDWLIYNPIGAILTEARHWIIDPSAPGLLDLLTPLQLLVPVCITLGLFALGVWIFDREAPGIAERL